MSGAVAFSVERERSLDLLRGVAAVGMVCAHVAWAFLAPSGRGGAVWYTLDVLFGSVAPLYLVLSGITLRRSLERDGSRSGARRRLRRAVRLLLLGVWLQIPILSLRQILWNHQPAQIAQLLNFNVLHVVAIAALLLIPLSRLLSLRATVVVAGVLACVLLFTEPLLSLLLRNRSLVHPYLNGLIGPEPRATLPLLPFLLYPLAGFVCGAWATGVAGPKRHLLRALAGVGVVSLALLLNLLLPSNTFWENSPAYLLFRLGMVGGALGLAGWWGCLKPGRLARFTEWMGRGSLPIYIIHFVLLYGSPLSSGATSWWGGSLVGGLAPGSVALISALLLALTLGAWWFWLWLHTRAPLVALGAKRLFWGVFWGIFLSRP